MLKAACVSGLTWTQRRDIVYNKDRVFQNGE